MKLFVCLILIFLESLGSDGAKILGIFHPPAPSHFFCGGRLLKELASRGHEVTMISAFETKPPIKNYKDVLLTGSAEVFETMKETMTKIHEQNIITQILHIFQMGPMMAENTLKHANVQKLLKSDEKFDLIIMEAFMNEIHLGFAHHYDAPIVILSTIGSNPWVNQYTVNPAPSSYVSEVLLNHSGKMTFLQRLQNLVVGTMMNMYANYIILGSQNEVLHKYFPTAPHIKDLFNRVSLVLLNSHVSVSSPKPHLPNMIEIGGFHMEDVKELPKDLKEYLDSCKKGFILFSMGSNFKSTQISPNTLQTILKVFAKLPYNILWKFEAPELPGKPDNVRIEKWLPQNDILAHGNLRLFITHGGLLSTTEAVFHGVPIVGIPIFGDQKMNMAKAEHTGIGKSLEFANLQEESFLATVKEVIDNPIYRTNIRRRSMIMRDQPLKPIENAVFWVEHVLRHKGADHFKTGALELYWYELYQLDVLAVIFGGIFIMLYVSCKTLRCLLCRKSKTQYKPEKKKKH